MKSQTLYKTLDLDEGGDPSCGMGNSSITCKNVSEVKRPSMSTMSWWCMMYSLHQPPPLHTAALLWQDYIQESSCRCMTHATRYWWTTETPEEKRREMRHAETDSSCKSFSLSHISSVCRLKADQTQPWTHGDPSAFFSLMKLITGSLDLVSVILPALIFLWGASVCCFFR